MKNNIILILVVTVISIAVIIISVMVSMGGHGSEGSSSGTSGSSTSDTSRTEPVTSVTEENSEPEPVSVQSDPQTSESSRTEDIPETGTAADIIALARSLIGTDFADGGETPAGGFDNSGFIYYVLRENGYITCPRGVSAQSEMGAVLGYDEVKPGDLVFFSESGTTAEFGGIYAGNGVMVACLMPGTQVKEVDITSNYYTSHFYRGVGII